MTEPRQALDEVARLRTAMAKRVRLPWWYPPLLAVTFTTLLSGPLLDDHYRRLGLPLFPYTMASTLVLMVLLIPYRRFSALHVMRESTLFPAMKRYRKSIVAIALPGLFIELGCYLLDRSWSGALWTGITVAGLFGVFFSIQICRINAGIRRDIETGQTTDV